MSPFRMPAIPQRRVPLWLLGTLLICFLYFLPRPGEWNQDARLDMSLAIVNHATVQIDQYHWNAGVDAAQFEGHYYQNKAPGQSLLAVPVLAAYKGMLVLAGQGSQASRIGEGKYFKHLYFQFYMAQCLASMYTVSIPAALIMLLFFWFLGYLVESLVVRVLLTLATALATIVFPYSQVFYPHVPTAGFLFASFALVYALGRREPAPDGRGAWIALRPGLAAFLAGACLGGAFFVDHTAVIPGALIGLYALTRLGVRNLALLVLGGIPALMVVFAYDYAVFHDISVTGYNWSGGGIAGSDASGVPETNGLWGMTFSPYRGLFFVSPFLLLALPGYYLWARRGGLEWLLCLAVPLSYLLFVTTIYYWQGGSAVGPRYLVCVILFLAAPIALVLERARTLWLRGLIALLVGLSFFNIWIQTIAAKGYPPKEISNPLFDFAIPHVANGNVALSMGSVLFAPITGVYSKWTLLPLLVVVLLWTLFCTRRDRKAHATDTSAVPSIAGGSS